MVNHVRTLLLNESQYGLLEAGFPYGSPWVVSPRFEPVRVPEGLVPVRNAVFSGTDSWESRINRVEAVMSVLGAVDMSPFMSAFDTRSTVTETGCLRSIRGLFDRIPSASGGFEQAVIDSARGAPGLFALTGVQSLDEVIPALSFLARGSFEWEMRFSAIVLAYCAQLEKENRRASGV
jgi:hypothetical protein